MVDVTVGAVRLGFAVVYVLTFLAAVLEVNRSPSHVRRYGYLLAGAILLSPVVIVLQEAGIGQIAAGEGAFDVVGLLRAVLTTLVFWLLILELADVSNQLRNLTIVIAMTPSFASAFAPVAGDNLTGVFGLVYLVGFFLPYPILLYLFRGRIWAAAGEVSRERRLLHWKARNILLFTYGILLVYVPLSLGGVITDPVLSEFAHEYTTYFLYAGVAMYLIYNYDRLDPGDAAEMAQYLPETVGPRTAD